MDNKNKIKITYKGGVRNEEVIKPKANENTNLIPTTGDKDAPTEQKGYLSRFYSFITFSK